MTQNHSQRNRDRKKGKKESKKERKDCRWKRKERGEERKKERNEKKEYKKEEEEKKNKKETASLVPQSCTISPLTLAFLVFKSCGARGTNDKLIQLNPKQRTSRVNGTQCQFLL